MKNIEELKARHAKATVDFHVADHKWSVLLPKTTNARYLPVGRGSPGSELRQAYDVREAARAAWEQASNAYREADLASFRTKRRLA